MRRGEGRVSGMSFTNLPRTFTYILSFENTWVRSRRPASVAPTEYFKLKEPIRLHAHTVPSSETLHCISVART